MDSQHQSVETVPVAHLDYLRWPWLWLLVSAVVLGLAINYAGAFRFDASSDTLVVEGDADLALYEQVVAVFGGDEFLFLTFQPNNGQPISPEALATLQNIVEELEAVPGVKSVFSVLDAPLLKSPPVSLGQLSTGLPTLQSESVDLQLAQQELLNSPFFRELLITRGGDATAIKINLNASERLQRATQARDMLSAQVDHDLMNEAHERAIHREYRLAREQFLGEREQLIREIREIRGRYQSAGVLHLGGVPMIAADMIAYVKSDLSVFGGSVIGLMVVALAFFFRRMRWVILPLATAGLSVVYTIGLLGYLDWQATVISSNFVSLLGITTISLTIHLIVQYRELLHTQPHLDKHSLVMATMRTKFAPCFYTALTTMAAFGSLTVSGIVPVEYFGWMMCVGIIMSFVVTFTFFPAVLLLLPKGKPSSNLGDSNSFIRALGEFTRWRPRVVAVAGFVMAVVAYFGVTQVSLDNRFAEYFDTDTEIFQGMRYIDQQLGGTIPFDVILRFPPYEEVGFDEDDDFFDENEDPYPERYWFTRNMLDRLEQVHRFLDEQPQVGKVISLTALEDFAREFTDGEKLTNLQIVAILGAIPIDLHGELISPYASPATGELRLSGRIVESGPAFDREAFRQSIVEFGVQEVNFSSTDVAVTGMMVLFNGMLAQLLDSQISTLSYVLLAVFIMFLLLLRSLPHALLGMIPNTLASATVIGAMGYSGIPLDMMTTTIAAICIGIGVDDTIHYLHRFREEYARWGDARIAVSFSHASIGRALYYTSITVMVGFSVLCFSNFVPTVMFGLWTAVAMALALLANLTLLPALLVLTHADKPAQPELRQTA
ncbi:MAG: MMPL family transporter [Pseudomonadota bacterium]